jgi:hypothetical protein
MDATRIVSHDVPKDECCSHCNQHDISHGKDLAGRVGAAEGWDSSAAVVALAASRLGLSRIGDASDLAAVAVISNSTTSSDAISTMACE